MKVSHFAFVRAIIVNHVLKIIFIWNDCKCTSVKDNCKQTLLSISFYSSFCFCWVKQLSIQNSDDFWLWSNFSTLRRLQKINLIHWAGWLNVGQPSFWLHFIPNTHTSAEVSLARIHSQMSWPFTRHCVQKSWILYKERCILHMFFRCDLANIDLICKDSPFDMNS